jgi:transcriptional regulator with XRE-family HTH domain
MDSEGPRFREARLALELTLQDLHKITEYSISTLSGVEHGHDRPSKRLRSLLIHCLDINEEWLKSGRGNMFRSGTAREALSRIWGSSEKPYDPAKSERTVQLEILREKSVLELVDRLKELPSGERKRWAKALLRLLDDLVAADIRRKQGVWRSNLPE